MPAARSAAGEHLHTRNGSTPSIADAAKATEMIREQALDAFSHHPISTRVNSPKNKDATLLDPVE